MILDRDAFPLKVSAFGPALARAHLEASPYLDPVGDAARRLGAARCSASGRRRAPVISGARPTSPLGIFWEAESLGRDTGRIMADDPDASNGRVSLARAGADRPGFVTFGPYRLLPPGRLPRPVPAEGRRQHGGAPGHHGGRARRCWAASQIHLADGAFVEVAVPFTLTGPTQVEYRTAVGRPGLGGGGRGDRPRSRASRSQPRTSRWRSWAHELPERADPHRLGRRRRRTRVPARTVRDTVWSGPLRRYPPGRYQLWVRLKLDQPVAGRVRARAGSSWPRAVGRAGGRGADGRRGAGGRTVRRAGRALHRDSAVGARVPLRVSRRGGRLVRSPARRAARGRQA